jgi:adenylate kinase
VSRVDPISVHRLDDNAFPFLAVIGPPGAGKSTQAALLARLIGMTPISVGHLLRKESAGSSPRALRVRASMSTGGLVTPQDSIEVLSEALRDTTIANGVVLDGYPRSLEEALLLDDLPVVDLRAVVCLGLPGDRVFGRVRSRRQCPTCGHVQEVEGDEACPHCGDLVLQRADDTVERTRARIDTFTKHMPDLRAYFTRTGRYVDIDATPPAEVVFGAVREVVVPSVSQREEV